MSAGDVHQGDEALPPIHLGLVRDVEFLGREQAADGDAPAWRFPLVRSWSWTACEPSEIVADLLAAADLFTSDSPGWTDGSVVAMGRPTNDPEDRP